MRRLREALPVALLALLLLPFVASHCRRGPIIIEVQPAPPPPPVEETR